MKPKDAPLTLPPGTRRVQVEGARGSDSHRKADDCVPKKYQSRSNTTASRTR